MDLTDDRWLAIVAALAKEERPCWMIVDGLGRGHGDTGTWADHALNAMAGIAWDVGCAVTFLCDGVGRGARTAIAGKMATVMLLDRDGSTTADMQFRVIEPGLGAMTGPLRLKFETAIPVVLRAPEPPKTAPDHAVAYLERELADGPRAALERIEAGKLGGNSKRRSNAQMCQVFRHLK